MSESTVEPGYCICGCGEYIGFWSRTDTGRGRIKGQPKQYSRKHPNRTPGTPYKVDPETNCWIWQRAMNRTGYGRIWNNPNRRHDMAHRVYYEQRNGPISEGLQLDHLCRNRACVNPDHLEPVAGSENIRRGALPKLNQVKAREIRDQYFNEGISSKRIAKQYGVSPNTILDLLKGKTWREPGAVYKTPERHKFLEPDQRREVADRKAAGDSASTLEQEYGIANWTVYACYYDYYQ